MNILVYATTLGADLLSMVRYLEQITGVVIKILVDNADQVADQPVFHIHPLESELIDKNFFNQAWGLPGFRPDITIMDNHIPYLRTSPGALVLWHGFGWKGPNDEEEFKWLHRQIRFNWGDAKKPNDRFIWQCFGPWDFEHRTQISGFHPENCRVLGAAGHDELRMPFDRSAAAPYYPFDIINKKTVLIAPTWHYGEVFAHWGGDRNVLTRLIDTIRENNGNIIMRLHDSFRYDKKYVTWLRTLEKSYPDLMLKFKDRHPDNFLDMQVSDLLITNFSSIANLFYATGKPTLHIYPVKNADESFIWRRYTLMGQKVETIPKAKYIWKMPPEENGGLLAKNREELIEKTVFALGNPDCCKQASTTFLERHMLGADGKNRERIWKVISELYDAVKI